LFYGFGEASSVEALENGGKSQEWWTFIEEEVAILLCKPFGQSKEK
jgi:hypothetical protein